MAEPDLPALLEDVKAGRAKITSRVIPGGFTVYEITSADGGHSYVQREGDMKPPLIRSVALPGGFHRYGLTEAGERTLRREPHLDDGPC